MLLKLRELLSQMLIKKKGIPHEVLNAKNHAREAEIIAHAGEKGAVTIATNMAGRGTDIKLGEGVKELGGLCVIGSERHESRRIDNQLRGTKLVDKETLDLLNSMFLLKMIYLLDLVRINIEECLII